MVRIELPGYLRMHWRNTEQKRKSEFSSGSSEEGPLYLFWKHFHA